MKRIPPRAPQKPRPVPHPALHHASHPTKALLALDQGATRSRAILFDHAGSVLAMSQREFPQVFPRPGWVENDPHALGSTAWDVAQSVVARAWRWAMA